MKHHMRSRARVESVVHQLNYQLLVGIDLGQWLHQACVLDANGEFLGERGFEHSLSALSATTDWLLNLAGKDAERIAVAIEKPHGAVVETLLDSGIAVFSINPKQVDRFRDRHSMSGAKDDRRDAFVLADALRTDGHRFQRLQLPPPEIIGMRELLKTRDQLVKNHVALSPQIRDLLARCWPHLVSLAPRDKALDSFFCKLLQLFFDARETADLTPKVIQDLVSKHRIRRVQPEQILKPLNNHRSASRQQPPKLLPLTSNCSFTSCSSFDNTAETRTSFSKNGSSSNDQPTSPTPTPPSVPLSPAWVPSCSRPYSAMPTTLFVSEISRPSGASVASLPSHKRAVSAARRNPKSS